MRHLGLYHDDPLMFEELIFDNKSLYYKRISFCFGLSDIEEPLAGIYKHSLWHFIYFYHHLSVCPSHCGQLCYHYINLLMELSPLLFMKLFSVI